jgi:glycosyltransferase involved in cell wall biosynthesis
LPSSYYLHIRHYHDGRVKQLDILIPTWRRNAALTVTLATLISQTYRDFNVIIAEQNDKLVFDTGPIQAVLRLMRARACTVSLHSNTPQQGMAQQRQFLLERSKAPYILFLDDDLLLEPWVVEHVMETIKVEGCGFVGSAPVGLSYIQDLRPEEQAIEFWSKRIQPERVYPGSDSWNRHKLHNAANLLHTAIRLNLTEKDYRKYKVAWVGGCVLYDRQKLVESGGFEFWHDLPEKHVGEDVYVQLQVMKRFGGCGLIPSGVYHQELETTINERIVDAPKYLPV